MAVVRPMPSLGVMAAAIAIDARHVMVAGSGREVVIDPAIGLVIVIPINPEIASVIGSVSGLAIVLVIEREIDPEIASVIGLKSASEIAPVPSTEIRTPFVQSLRTTVQVPDVFGTGMIVMANGVAPGMNGVSRPSAPDRVTTMAGPSGRMQHRRPQRPHPQRMI